MKQITYYQLIFLFLVSIICYIFFSKEIFVSAILGGVCYFIPTLIAVIFLYYLNNIKKSVIWVIYAELIKVIFCIICMFFILYFNKSFINWISFLLGFFSVSNSILFLFRKI